MIVVITDVPVHAPGVINRLIDGEMVLVHPAQGMVRVLNQVGARLWELVDGQRSVEEIAATIAAEYPVSRDRAKSDALAFCADLMDRGVLALAG
jgi:hypothetical protein